MFKKLIPLLFVLFVAACAGNVNSPCACKCAHSNHACICKDHDCKNCESCKKTCSKQQAQPSDEDEECGECNKKNKK